jgi:hypothetical protein
VTQPEWLMYPGSRYGQFLRAELGRLEAQQAAEQAAEHVARRAWIDGLAAKYGIVRLAASLTPEQLAAQADWVDRATGRKFLTTEPIGFACPWCGETCTFAISLNQALCRNNDCQLFMWDPTKTRAQMAAEGVKWLDLGAQ